MADSTAFISYAHEDIEAARRLTNDLKRSGLKVWLDKESLLPGQKWEIALRAAIKDSRYFVPLISSTSVKKKGYVQRELKLALDTLEEFPESQTYIIPARLDDCEPSHHRLKELHWVDMFPNWNDGLNKILLSVKADSQIPALESLITKRPTSTPISPNETAYAERQRSHVFQVIGAFAPPDLGPEALYESDKSFRAELDTLLADPSLVVEDKVTLSIQLIMRALDDQIERQMRLVNSVRQHWHLAKSIDDETKKLKRLIDKRSQMFNMLRLIIDKYNQTAADIIDSIGH